MRQCQRKEIYSANSVLAGDSFTVPLESGADECRTFKKKKKPGVGTWKWNDTTLKCTKPGILCDILAPFFPTKPCTSTALGNHGVVHRLHQNFISAPSTALGNHGVVHHSHQNFISAPRSFVSLKTNFSRISFSVSRITQRIYKKFPIMKVTEESSFSPFMSLQGKDEVNPALEFVKSVCQVWILKIWQIFL